MSERVSWLVLIERPDPGLLLTWPSFDLVLEGVGLFRDGYATLGVSASAGWTEAQIVDAFAGWGALAASLRPTNVDLLELVRWWESRRKSDVRGMLDRWQQQVNRWAEIERLMGEDDSSEVLGWL